jgi:hypothetical protein
VQESARKQFESQVADENRRTALAKSLERQQQRQAEAAEVRQQMQQVRSNTAAAVLAHVLLWVN